MIGLSYGACYLSIDAALATIGLMQVSDVVEPPRYIEAVTAIARGAEVKYRHAAIETRAKPLRRE
jgi:hypothetical protein